MQRLYWADAAIIGPVQVRYWQLKACLQGFSLCCHHTVVCEHIEKIANSSIMALKNKGTFSVPSSTRLKGFH